MHTRVSVGQESFTPSFTLDDRIFLGEGLFETLRVEASKPCFSHLHWQRLSNSAKQLAIPFDLSLQDWQSHLCHQIKKDNLYHGGIKAILSGGPAPRGLTQPSKISHLIFQTFNYTPKSQPLRLISVPWLRDCQNPIYQLKSINYLEAICARRQALASDADDALFFNTNHHATETTCANFFLIKENKVLTPAIEDGILPGITRARILWLCAKHNIPCLEQSLSLSLLVAADALFTTNSLQGLQSVSSLDSTFFEIEHPLMKQLASLYRQDVTHSQDL